MHFRTSFFIVRHRLGWCKNDIWQMAGGHSNLEMRLDTGQMNSYKGQMDSLRGL